MLGEEPRVPWQLGVTPLLAGEAHIRHLRHPEGAKPSRRCGSRQGCRARVNHNLEAIWHPVYKLSKLVCDTNYMERENRMQGSNREGKALTPEESWSAIQATMDKARTSMYLAGFSAILLLWGAITALGYLVEYGLQTWGVDFLGRNPWIRGPIWGSLIVGGMVGSSIIGHRAGKRNVDGNAARSTGLRVFLFWIAVTLAAGLESAGSSSRRQRECGRLKQGNTYHLCQ